MAGERILLDTNAAVHYLIGSMTAAQARNLIRHELHLSFISEIELRSFRKANDEQRERINRFLDSSVINDVTPALKDRAVYFRLTHGLATPDAIIAATASLMALPLLTADGDLLKLHKELEVRPVRLRPLRRR